LDLRSQNKIIFDDSLDIDDTKAHHLMVMVMLGFHVPDEISHHEESSLPLSHFGHFENKYIPIEKTFTLEHNFESISHHIDEGCIDYVTFIQVFNDTQTHAYALIDSCFEMFHMNDFLLLCNDDVCFVNKILDLFFYVYMIVGFQLINKLCQHSSFFSIHDLPYELVKDYTLLDLINSYQVVSNLKY
jgi:hypothetical protein